METSTPLFFVMGGMEEEKYPEGEKSSFSLFELDSSHLIGRISPMDNQPIEEGKHIVNLEEAMMILEQFLWSFPDSDKILGVSLFMRAHPEKKPRVNWSKARNMRLMEGLEWQTVDRALDVLLEWLHTECMKPKEQRDAALMKERGKMAYHAFTIMGHTNYSPIRTFQYGLAHFMAYIRVAGSQEEKKVCSKIRCGAVKWAICDILYPYARKNSNLMHQLQVMEDGMKQAHEMNQAEMEEKIKRIFRKILELKFPSKK